MAQRTRIELVDDLDGTVLADGQGETVAFSLDGRAYELDLSRANADAFRGLFQDYIAAGRRVGAPRRRVGDPAAGVTRYDDPTAVRKWAGSNKVDVPARGRIPRAVLERYHAAGN